MAKAWDAVESLGRKAARRATGLLPLTGDEVDEEPLFPALQWMTAALYVAAGAETLFRQRRRHALWRDPLRVAPLLAAPLAGAAHAVRAVSSSPPSRLAAQILDGVAAGVALAGLAQAAYGAAAPATPGQGGWPRPRSGRGLGLAATAAPLTFAATAVLGLLLEHEEEREREEIERLRRRASVVERLVPQRRRRFDRIVVHV